MEPTWSKLGIQVLVLASHFQEMAAQDSHHQLQEHQSHEVAVALAAATAMAMRLVGLVGLVVAEIEIQVMRLGLHQIKMEQPIPAAAVVAVAQAEWVLVPVVQDLLSFDIYCKNASV
jgi:hypothetical protein